MKSETLLEQRLEQLTGRIFDVDPQLVLGVAAPRIDQLHAVLAELAVAQNTDSDRAHINWLSGVYCRFCDSATAL